jgi:hypothetical protein
MKTLMLDNVNLTSIQPNVLNNFNLRTVYFSLSNFAGLLPKFNDEWFDLFNSDVLIDFNKTSIDYYRHRQMTLQITDSDANYSYPDEDFCYIVKFSFQRLVFPLLIPSNNANCSCTGIWLIRFYPLASNSITLKLFNKFAMKCSANLFQSIIHCNFDQRLKDCETGVPKYNSRNTILSNYNKRKFKQAKKIFK